MEYVCNNGGDPVIRFGVFEADLERGELRRQGVRIKLQDQPFQILHLLVEHAGEIVTREELQRRLWSSDTFVDFDRSLNKAINKLRDALDDSADNPRFIETVPKRGYRFIASVETSAATTLSANPVALPSSAPLRRGIRARETLALGTVLVLLVACVLLALSKRRDAAPPSAVLRTAVTPPANASFLPYSFAISPDGSRLVFAAVDRAGKTALWIRALSASSAQRLEGTEDATFPFWAPDSRRIGFFSQRRLKTIEIAGSVIHVLAEAPSGHGGAWSRNDVIIFAPSVAGPLFRINASGGTPAQVTPVRTKSQSHSMPAFLPDGNSFFFYAFRSVSADAFGDGVYIARIDAGTPKIVSPDLSGNVVFASGHLLYVRDRSLLARPFDAARLQPTGDPFILAEQELEPDRTFARSPFSVSDNGTVIFQSSLDSPARLIWFDSTGKEIGPFSDSVFRDPSFSPDGRYLAFASDDGHNAKYSIRVFDLEQSVNRRLTEPGTAGRPVWSRNGKEITYAATQGRTSYLYRVPADGSAPPRILLSGTVMLPNCWSSDHLVFLTTDTGFPSLEIYSDTDGSVSHFTSGAEAQFSPDGKWIAYIGQGGVAGGGGIVVQRFADRGAPIQISGPGGAQARWSRDGRKIFFMMPDRKLLSADFDPVHGIAGPPKVVFQTRIIAPNLASFQYDIAPDGRFLINSFPSTDASPLTVITGWHP